MKIFNQRKRKRIFLNNDYSKIVRSKELINTKEIKLSNLIELYFDIESVLEFENVFIFYLPFRSYQKNCLKKNKFITKLVIIDKTHKCLIIFKSYDDMLKYLSGQQNYEYYYQTNLHSFLDINEIRKIIYNKNLFYCKSNKYQEELYSCYLISYKEKQKYIYEFASIHINKINIFRKTIENIIKFKYTNI